MNINSIDEVRQKIKELEAVVDKLEAIERKQESKPWPQVGEEYWCTADWRSNGVFKAVWRGDEVDHFRFASGDCHHTEAEALAYREWQTDPRVVARGMVERQSGFNQESKACWLWYSRANKRVEISKGVQQLYLIGGLSFDSTDTARAALNNLGEDLCKVALGVITDKEEGSRIVRLAMSKRG